MADMAEMLLDNFENTEWGLQDVEQDLSSRFIHFITIVNETEKAILVKLKDDPEKGVWLPKAHVGISKNTAKIPYWMTSLKKVTLW